MSFLLRTPPRILTKVSRAPLSASINQTRHASLDSSTISKVTDAEKKITGSDEPVKGGPTAQAQKHAGETLNSENMADTTEGEKKVTGQERPIKGGPTARVQSEVSKDR